MESALPAAGFLYWVGAGTVAYLTLRISYSLFMAFRVWGLGHEAGVGPELGEWAGELDPAPPAPSLLQRVARLRRGLACTDQFRIQRMAFLSPSPFSFLCLLRPMYLPGPAAISGLPRLVEFLNAGPAQRI